MKSYIAYFNEQSTFNKVITVLGAIVAVNFMVFLLGVALCLLAGIFKIVVVALAIGVVCYGIKVFKDKIFSK